MNAVVESVGTLSLSSVATMWRSEAMEGIVSFDTLEWSNVRSERGGAQKTLQAKFSRSSLADFIASEQFICLCSYVTEDTYPGAWSAGAPSVSGKYG